MAESGRVFSQTKPKLAAYTHLVLLGTEKVPAPTIADIITETRQTYSGPLEVGEDLMAFEIGEAIAVRQFKALSPHADKAMLKV
jgi:ribonuclease Z